MFPKSPESFHRFLTGVYFPRVFEVVEEAFKVSFGGSPFGVRRADEGCRVEVPHSCFELDVVPKFVEEGYELLDPLVVLRKVYLFWRLEVSTFPVNEHAAIDVNEVAV